jgi:DeoR/GlpR family transcriptional regulator of sugar metabolism
MATDRVLAPERRDRILGVLGADGRVVASELAGRLGVSLDTVRRDLDELAAAGALRRVHGGALPAPSAPARFVDRTGLEVGAKAAIATVAAGLVMPGQVLLLGGGTTVVELARRLPDELQATAITSSPDVAVALLDHPEVEVVLLGGPVNPETRTVTGAEAVQAVRSIRANLCFLGACSLDADAGLTVLDREEAGVERAMVAHSERLTVLTDATKLGRAGPYLVGAASDVDVLVTDTKASREAVAELGRRGVEVMRA